ncbi:MAG: hypothetical protein ACRC8S_00345 [Fimbriiglobus sp.]
MKTHPPQRPSRKLAVAVLMVLSVGFYILSLVTRLDDKHQGYDIFWMMWQASQRETLPIKLLAIWIYWMNLLWYISIICYFTKHLLGQFLFSIPNVLIIALAALILFSKLQFNLPNAPLFWAFSMIAAYCSGLLNYATHPRPQTVTTEDG